MFDEPLAVAMAIKAVALEWRRQDHEGELRDALARTLQETTQSTGRR